MTSILTTPHALQVTIWLDGTVKGSTDSFYSIDTWTASGAASFAKGAHDGRSPAGEPNSDWPGDGQGVESGLMIYYNINSTGPCEASHLLGAWSLPNQSNLQAICCSPCPTGSSLSMDSRRCECDAGYTGLGLVWQSRRLLATSSATSPGDAMTSASSTISSTAQAMSTSSWSAETTTPSQTPPPPLQSCTACGIGKYKNVSGTSGCVACPQGRYSQDIGAVSEMSCLQCPSFSWSPAGAANASNCTCILGYTGANGQECAACTPGKFKDTNGTSPCRVCSMGSYSLAGQSLCTQCPAGSMSVAGSGSKAMCTYNVIDIEVSSNVHVNLTVFHRLQPRILEAYAIVIGVQSSAVRLQSAREILKVVGIFRRLFTSQANTGSNITVYDILITLPKDSVSESVQRLEQNLTVYLEESGLPAVALNAIKRTCGAGAEPDPVSKQCLACRRGTFKFMSDNSSCLPCATNASTANAGSLLEEHCTCNPGYYSFEKLKTNTSCIECGLGHFCTGNQSRSPCPAGTYGISPTLGMRSSCRLCPLNTSSSLASFRRDNCSCDKGYTGPNYTACLPCEMGHYKPVVGDNIECTPCAEGTYLNEVASRSMNCSTCPANSWSGQGSPSQRSCTCIMAHTNPDGMPCIPCAAGTYKNINGSADCLDCGAGTYSLQAASGCESCPRNTFSGAIAASSLDSCESCPDFSTSPEESVALENCTCNAGRYPRGRACVLCSKCNEDNSIYRFDRATCLPCSGQENHDKYAGQGEIEEPVCQGSDIKYGYEYVYSSNELRLEWSADWDSMYPWAPRCVGPM